jgi:hydroxymethylglutaryl-CoA lyase
MLGDTAGTATPGLVRTILGAIEGPHRPKTIRCHFHDTFGRALLNSWTAVQCGIEAIDASLMGLGGEPHPYFTEPLMVNNGNLATEEIFLLLAASAGETQQSRQRIHQLFETCRWLVSQLHEPVFGRASFAEFVPLAEDQPDEIQQTTYRH